MLDVSIPNPATFSALVDTATKWWATEASPNAAVTHARADPALVSVSTVVNVLDDTMNRVSAGSRSAVASQKSLPSTFDTNRTVSGRSVKDRSASYAIAGPRSDPPIPMLMMLRIRLPVAPAHDPSRTRVAND